MGYSTPASRKAWMKDPYKEGKSRLKLAIIAALLAVVLEWFYLYWTGCLLFNEPFMFFIALSLLGWGAFCWLLGFLWAPTKPNWFSLVNLYRHLFAKNGWSMLLASLIVTIIFIGILSAGTLLLKDILANQYIKHIGVPNSNESFWFVVKHFMDAGNITDEKDGNEIYALICAFIGIFILSGLAVSSFVNIISKVSDRWKKGLIHYNLTFDDYVVIIGYNEQTANLVRSSLNKTISNKKVRFVLIQTRQDVEKARESLELKLNKEEEKWVVFYSGERTSKEDIAALHLEKALEVFVLGEDMHKENEQDHDTYNINCLQLISAYIKNCKKINAVDNKLRCHVNLEYQSTYTVFKSVNIYKVDKKIEFLPFNVHEIWAKKVLVDNYAVVPDKDGKREVERYLPLDNYGIDENSTRTVHLFILGMNQMGTALGTQAALLAHYPNFHVAPLSGKNEDRLRTTITFIDDQAFKEGEFFRGRFAQLFSLCRYRTLDTEQVRKRNNIPWIDPMNEDSPDFEYRHTYSDHNYLDVQWEFIQGNVAAEEIQRYMLEIAENNQKECTIAVCFNNPQQSAATAVYLPEKILKKVNQVLVYQQNKFELINMVSSSEREWKRYEKLRPFGMIEDCYTNNMFEEITPQLAHCLYSSITKSISLGENAADIDEFVVELKRHWDELDMSTKLSNINMADSIGTKIRSLGLIETIDLEGLDFSSKARFLRIFADGLNPKIHERLRDENMLKSLAKIEHTRWLTERLIIGYRPVNAYEYKIIHNCDNENSFNNNKEYFKNKNRAHLDICSNAKLSKVDPFLAKKQVSTDESVVKSIPDFIRAKSLILSRLAFRVKGDVFNPYRKYYINKYDEDGIAQRILKRMIYISENGLIPFWICSETVSIALWREVMLDRGTKGKPNKPITNISKEDAENFIRILNNKTGLCFRLPTKEEWEAAAKLYNKEKHKVCNVNTMHELLTVDKDGYCGNGLYHMAGNVWEWTSSPIRDRNGKPERSFIYCGGSYKYGNIECDIKDGNNNWYNYGLSDFRSEDLGFRIVLSHDFKRYGLDGDEFTTQSMPIAKIIDKLFDGCDDMGKMVEIKKTPCDDTRRYCMGSNHTLEEEEPAHFAKLHVSGMFVCSYLVTQKLWMSVMKNNPSLNKGDTKPVENVSYERVCAFLKELNDALPNSSYIKSHPEYSSWQFRLPTEAEWEYIAKGGAFTHFPAKAEETADAMSKKYNKYSAASTDEEFDEVAWHYGITKTTHPVGRKRGCIIVDQDTINDKRKDAKIESEEDEETFMRQFMVFDICGNVWEWCADDFDADAYKKGLNADGVEYNVTDPKENDAPRYVGIFRPSKQSVVHSIRGGSFKCTPNECRVTRASRRLATQGFDDLGFRLIFAEGDFIEKSRKANEKQ